MMYMQRIFDFDLAYDYGQLAPPFAHSKKEPAMIIYKRGMGTGVCAAACSKISYTANLYRGI